MLKKIVRFVIVSSSLLIFSAAVGAQQLFIANLSGAQETPPILTGAGATCRLRFNQSQMQGELTCKYFNIFSSFGESININLHGDAAVGETAPSLLNFQVPLSNGSSNGTFTLTFNVPAGQFTQIRANKNYITLMYPPSTIIRGQFHVANSAYNDFDGDGRTDLTVYRSSDRTFYARESLGDGDLLTQQIGQAGDSVSLTVDFNGDGRSDFSTAGYNGDFIWRIVPSTIRSLTETRWGNSNLGDFFAAADYDGDGAFDIGIFRGGTWYYIESSTGTYRAEQWGKSGDVPAPNDFDRDGKADLTVARSENGVRVWYVRRSSDNQTYAVQWGLSSDAFFTGRADWDGDGAADISVIRNESGQRVFYILRSSDNQLQVIRWGASSDLVKLGDYDGDGKTDATVTRAVNGAKVFFILQSSTGTLRTEYFGLPSDF